jgi:NADPH:quinone reductase
METIANALHRMGDLGRTIPGTYAEYTVARVSNIVPLVDDGDAFPLQWDQVAALPESYSVAWTCLFRNLALERGHKLLIRGATSALGIAAVNLAVEAGAVVTATTRSEEKFEDMKWWGITEVALEGKGLPARLQEQKGEQVKFDRVLELIGNTIVVESLALAKRDGRVCLAGWRAGLDPIREFNPLLEMASGVHLNFFGSFVFEEPEFPLSDIPLRKIVRAVAERKFDAKPYKVWRFGEKGIQEAHRYMEEGLAKGKMVVVVGEEGPEI